MDEQWLLDPERYHFMQLLATEKDQGESGVHAEEWEAIAELKK